MAEKKPEDRVRQVLADFDEDKKPHSAFCTKVEQYYKSYRAIPERNADAAQWESQLFPPYAFQIIESLTANVVDPTPHWKVTPRPTSGSDLELLSQGAKANETLLASQVEADGFAAKQMFFAKQAFIAGISVFKTHWNYQPGSVTRRTITGRTREEVTLKDDPTAEVIDVRDWIPHQAATSLDTAMRVTHRCFYTFDQLKRLEKQGVYGSEAGGQAVESLKESKDFAAELSEREQSLFQADRTKDQIEVLEQWRREPDGSLRVVAVGNRKVLLRDRPSPFDHGKYPFVVCAPIPDLGRIAGISVIELVKDLQDELWTLGNQRLDNVRLINNHIVCVTEDMEDVDGFVWAPGAINTVSHPDQVFSLKVDPLPSQVSISAESMIQQDLQNVSGANPALLGQQAQNTSTATEVSLTTTLAQRRVALMKQQFKWAFREVGEQWISLNQQFVTDERLVATLGPDGAQDWMAIHPLLLQGDYGISIDAIDESLVRQERRAEKQALLQMALQSAPVFAAIAQSDPEKKTLNLEAFMNMYLEEFDIGDKSKFYSNKTQPIQPGPQQQPGQPPGATAPQAIDANSPSNAFSQSPVAAMQQMSAMGGPSN